MKRIVNSKSNAFVAKAVETVEEKFQEYATANLRERHNGTFHEKTEELGKSLCTCILNNEAANRFGINFQVFTTQFYKNYIQKAKGYSD